jgi:O-antigen/teichoic acid export membrane protein
MEKKQSETGRSIARNVLYGFSTFVFPLGLSFVATPILIATLGLQKYGIFMLVLGFVGFSFIFSFSRAITKYIAEYRASGENEKIPDVISVAFFINLIVGLLSILIIWLSANWLVSDVLKIDAEVRDEAVIALYIASLIIFLAMLTQIFTAILQGIHRFDVYSKIFNLNNIAVLTGNILLAVGGFGIISLLVWNLVVTGIICLIFARSAKRLLPEFKIFKSFQTKILKLLVGYSASNIVYQILSNFLLLFERGWITRYFGAENLTYYVVPMTLAFYIHGFISSLMLVIFPLASELKNNKTKLLRLYLTATKTVCFFVIFLGTTIIVESRFFLTLWLGAEFADKTALLLIIHTITFSLAAILAVSWQMTEGLGYPNYNCFLFVINLSISLFLMIGLTESYGNIGVAIGRFSGFAIIFCSIFCVEKWFFGRIQREFWLKLLSVLTVSAILSGTVEKLIINNFALNWTTFAAANLGGGIIYCAVLWLLGFADEDEKLLVWKILSR